jgi:hypothetical protein
MLQFNFSIRFRFTLDGTADGGESARGFANQFSRMPGALKAPIHVNIT